MSKAKKRFHVAYWSDKRPRELNGINYEADDMSKAIDLYCADSKTPELSRVKYVFEVGDDNADGKVYTLSFGAN